MAKTAMKIKQQRKAKFSTREYTRCRICGSDRRVRELLNFLTTFACET